MADLWYPNAVRMVAPGSLWNPPVGGRPKLVLHTTEGGRGVVQVSGGLYFGRSGTMPNATLAIYGGQWRICQHIPNNYGSDALVNAAGGVQTNRYNVAQVEIAWKSAEISQLPEEAFAELGHFLAWDHVVRGTPLVAPVGFNTPGRAHRLTFGEWTNFAGVCGHQHVPENDHTDPGAFDIDRLLKLAGGAQPAPAPTPSPVSKPWPNRLLLKGVGTPQHPDADVRTYQQRMHDRGWTIGVDGIFGNESDRITRQFQQEKNLAVDGVVGRDTWNTAFRSDNVS